MFQVDPCNRNNLYSHGCQRQKRETNCVWICSSCHCPSHPIVEEFSCEKNIFCCFSVAQLALAVSIKLVGRLQLILFFGLSLVVSLGLHDKESNFIMYIRSKFEEPCRNFKKLVERCTCLMGSDEGWLTCVAWTTVPSPNISLLLLLIIIYYYDHN